MLYRYPLAPAGQTAAPLPTGLPTYAPPAGTGVTPAAFAVIVAGVAVVGALAIGLTRVRQGV